MLFIEREGEREKRERERERGRHTSYALIQAGRLAGNQAQLNQIPV